MVHGSWWGKESQLHKAQTLGNGSFITSKMIARSLRTSPKNKISSSHKFPIHRIYVPCRIKFIPIQVVSIKKVKITVIDNWPSHHYYSKI